MLRRMWLLRLVSLMLAAVLMLGMMPVPGMAEEEGHPFDATADNIFKRFKTIGAALVIAKGDEIIYEHYYGLAIRHGRIPVTENTRFKAASVSKMVAGIGVMTLVEEGRLELDRDLSDYYGWTLRNSRYARNPITLRMIMSHTASLRDGGSYSGGGKSLQSMLDVTRRRTANFEDWKPGSKYRYSNLGGGMLGSIMEQVTGQSVHTVMKEHVFGPLGIDAAYDINLLADNSDTASLYRTNGDTDASTTWFKSQKVDDTCNPDAHFRTTVGALWISGRDLCRIGMMMCNGGEIDGVRILQPETVAEMMSDQKGKGGITGDSIYGLNVNRIPNLIKDTMIYGHQGLATSMLANLYFEPESGLTFAMLTNGCNNAMTDRIGTLARRMFEAAWAEFAQ